jgi:hypothetical protein
MKKLIFCLFILMIGCHNKNEKSTSEHKDVEVDSFIEKTNDSMEQAKIVSEDILNFKVFKQFQVYNLSDTIKEDFNGDGTKDKMIICFQENTKKLIFIDGLSNELEVLGNDKSFDGIISDLQWVDFWGTTRDKETGQVLIEDGEVAGGQDVKLEYISLFFRMSEVGGGVVTYRKKGKKFVWIHQSC